VKLSKLIFRTTFTVAFTSIVIASIVSIFFQYNNYLLDTKYLKNEFTQNNKELIKSEVQKVLEYIHYRQNKLQKESSTATFLQKEMLQKRLQEEILEWIATLRYGKENYIFVNTLDGYALVYNGEKLEQPFYWKEDDVFQKELKASYNQNGGYFNYLFKKLNTNDEFPKMAYVIQYEPWNWMIGSGVYIDEIEEKLEIKNQELQDTILYQIYFLVGVIIIFGVFLFFISKKVSRFLSLNINYLTNNFRKASRSHTEINIEKLNFTEFKKLAKSLNKTLKSRNEVESKLKDHVKIINENVMILTTNKKGRITEVSNALCVLTGFSAVYLLGKNFRVLDRIKTSKSVYQTIWNNLKQGKQCSCEIKNKNINDELYYLKSTIYPNIRNEKVIGYTFIAEDITDKKRVEYLSITDGLTNLYNRRHFNDIFVQEINRIQRNNKYLVFIMLDVDFFKLYNDTYGHQKGDEVLVNVATVLQKNTKRASDFVFRLGGEEFGVLFEVDKFDQGVEFAMNLMKTIKALHIEHQHSSKGIITVSVGVAIKNKSTVPNADELYKLADDALYEAKNTGRDKLVMSQ
jgi:diguanylate cyclase (GGDEF)-like protein/PAS domain S-box-containing protein